MITLDLPALFARVFNGEVPRLWTTDDLLLVSNAIAAEYRQQGASNAETATFLNAVTATFYETSELTPRQRHVSIVALWEGFGFQVEAQPDGRYRAKLQTAH